MGLHAQRWPGADYWMACTDKTLTLDELIRRSEVCVAGVDGGGLDDLFALAIIGRERETKRWLHWAHCWAFDDVMRQRTDIPPPPPAFQRAGDMTNRTQGGDAVRRARDHSHQG